MSAVLKVALFALVMGLPTHALAVPAEPVWSLVRGERQTVIETLRQLLTIESGGRDK